jgi:CheY-like chemotaxis protein
VPKAGLHASKWAPKQKVGWRDSRDRFNPAERMPRLLLVDDDDSLRTVWKIALVKMGHEVTEARDGREAMILFEQAPPDIVITDLVMPEKDGLEMIRDLRRLHPDVKIIAISGGGRMSAANYLKIGKAMGADVVLPKPFLNEELRAAIAQLSGAAGAGDALAKKGS